MLPQPASNLSPRYVQCMREITQYCGFHFDDYQKSLFSQSRSALDPDAFICDRSLSIYHVAEQSPQWQEHLKKSQRMERHQESVRRRIGNQLKSAMQRQYCLCCWMPYRLCICNEVANAAPLFNPFGDASIVLHCDEFLRISNTGHVAALALNASFYIWGIPHHDEAIANISQKEQGSGMIVLYPHHEALPLHSVLEVGRRPHLLLIDCTWGEAHSVNRHIPPHFPRAALAVPDSYVSLFAPLRSQTRTTGISTLEATSFAAKSVIDFHQSTGSSAEAHKLEREMTQIMKHFVDYVRWQKNQLPVYSSPDDPFQVSIKNRLTETRKAWQLVTENSEEAQESRELNRITMDPLPPPVLNYCEVCEKYVGFHRMVEHMQGSGHRKRANKHASHDR